MSQRHLRVGLCLVIIIAVAFFLRVIGLNWDYYSYLHPDERFLTTIASKIGKEEYLSDAVREQCDNHRENGRFFDTACSPYNPNNINDGSFAYGTLPLFIVSAVAQLVQEVNIGDLENPQQWLMSILLQSIGTGLMVVGVIFSFLGVLGILRLPDAYSRLHASGKTSTLGILFICVGTGFIIPTAFLKLLALAIFIVFSGSVGSFAI